MIRVTLVLLAILEMLERLVIRVTLVQRVIQVILEMLERLAIRETQEEVGLTPTGLEWAGELSFQFRDGYSLHVDLYRASGWTGELQETDEAKPFWCSTSEIPYGRMWADDEQWMPRLLAGEKFRGWFEFEGDRMEWFRMEVA